VEALVRAPAEPGRYLIAWDMVREGISWFSWREVPPGMTRLVVTPGVPDTLPDLSWAEVSSADLMARVQADSTASWQTAGRRRLWPIAWKLFLQRPVSGWGADTFRLRYAAQLPPGRWDPRLHANNLYLELLATAGLLGLGAWSVHLGLSGLRVRASMTLREKALAAALLVFTLHGLFDSFLEFYGIMGIFWIASGAWSAGSSGASATGGLSPRATRD
jgi:O-antigen ligase